MANTDTEIKKVNKSKEITPKKKKMIICSIISAVVLVVALALFITLYLMPYNEAKAEYNAALKQFNIESAALEDRNKELDNSIESLHQVINAKNIPVDELLLSVAQDVLKEAREYHKDSAPEVPKLTSSIEEVKLATSEILALAESVSNMGDYTTILTKIKDTETEYSSMIKNFKTSEIEVVWVGVDKEYTVLRFVIKLSNPNNYTLRDINIEWTALDVDGSVVGSYSGSQPDIPANGYIYYVGGAGSANLSGIPATVEVKVITDGVLTNRAAPKIDVSNVQVKNNGFGWYTVSADCQTDTEINSSQLDGQFIVKDANGKIIDADFWSAENLPDTLKENGKFKVSGDYFDLPSIPKSAEVYMYYKWD